MSQIFCKYCQSEKFTAHVVSAIVKLYCAECGLFILTADELPLEKSLSEEILREVRGK